MSAEKPHLIAVIERQGWTVEQVAERFGCHPKTVRRAAKPDARVSRVFLEYLAELLNVHPATLLWPRTELARAAQPWRP